MVLQFWTYIGATSSNMDPASVQGLELMCPQVLSDKQAITSLFNHGGIFQEVERDDRYRIKAKILDSGVLMIPTLASLFKNCVFLSEGAKVIKRLINTPIVTTGQPTLEEGCRRSFYASDHRAAYLRLWQFTLQHFEPAKFRSQKANRKPEDERWHHLALLAHALNYKSPLITQHQNSSPSYNIASTFLAQQVDQPRPEDVQIIADILLKYESVRTPSFRRDFYTNSGNIPKCDRYGTIKTSYAFDPSRSLPRPLEEHNGITGLFVHVATFQTFFSTCTYEQAPPPPSPPHMQSPPRQQLPRRQPQQLPPQQQPQQSRPPQQPQQSVPPQQPPTPNSQALVLRKQSFPVHIFDVGGTCVTIQEWKVNDADAFAKDIYESAIKKNLKIGGRVISGNLDMYKLAVGNAIAEGLTLEVHDSPKRSKRQRDDESIEIL